MKLKRFLFFAALLGGTSFAHAQDEGDRKIGSRELPKFLKQFDTNEDGRIDEEERQAIRDYRRKLREERRNSIDANDDGQISREEIEAARAAIRKRIEAKRLARFNEIAGEDDLISREEFGTIPGMNRLPEWLADALFARLDKDADGGISADEFLLRLRPHLPIRPPVEIPSKPGVNDADE